MSQIGEKGGPFGGGGPVPDVAQMAQMKERMQVMAKTEIAAKRLSL